METHTEEYLRPIGVQVQLKSLPDVLLERRATSHFLKDPVPEEALDSIIRLALQAPSGYNLQPWRFMVIRDQEARERLKRASFNQAKIGEAPVVVIAIGMKEECKQLMDEVFKEGVRHGVGTSDSLASKEKSARQFLSSMRMDVWLNRHVMIAFTVMMLAAETFGYDTAPMEGFDGDAIKREFQLPDEAEVVALLAIGTAKKPEKLYPGRFSPQQVVFDERFGNPLKLGT